MTKHESIRILYIEDDPGLARLVQKRLGRVGYEVDIAADGEEGVAKYERDSYDVMFVDQTLPVYDGLEVIRILGSKGILPPTIMITGTGDEQVAVEAMKLGAGDYIVKDAEGGYLELLPSVVEKVIDQRRAITEKQRAEEALKEAGDKLENLHEVARRLATCTSEEEVYHLVVDAARRIITFSYCSLGMVEGKEIVTKVAYPHPVSHEARTITVDEGLAGTTSSNGKKHLLRKMEKGTKSTSPPSHYLSFISSPIGDLGIFQVASLEPDAFTTNDSRLLELLLGHTAAAIKRVRLQSELKEQAMHDPLTGLHNRYYFDTVLSQEIKRSKRYKHCMAFLMIDVNKFKEINDRYGHQVGDEVLKEVAVLLRESVREADIVVRYGGDEFVIVLLETDGESEIVKQRIVKKIALRNKKNGRFDFPVTLSIGSTYWDPQDFKSVEEVLNEADRHMYEEKKRNNGLVKGGSDA
jgi:diguanylate cyclase (GGDEF)-like protein